MLKIRLMRIGAKGRPFYRVVVVDERAKRNGAYVELVGTYNPLTTPKEILLKKDRIEHWLKMGAIKSDGFLRILGEAPQRPPRKPKKAVVEKVAPKTEEAPAKETEEVKEEVVEQATEEVVAPTETPAETETETEVTPQEEQK